MTWWIWSLLGFVLLLLEMVTPGGFFFVFFGVAGLAVAALTAVGLSPTSLQLLVFSGLSVGSLLLFRGPLLRRLKRRPHPDHSVDSIAGEIATLTEDLGPYGTAQGELRGTVWSVQNETGEALRKGQRCRIERVDGLKLIVKPE